MDEKEKEQMLQRENFKAGLREEAHALALIELKATGLTGEEAVKFFNERTAELYAERVEIFLDE